MGSEQDRDRERGRGLGSEALVWLDEESGEELLIEVVGEAPWVKRLEETGFVAEREVESGVARRRCRVVFPTHDS